MNISRLSKFFLATLFAILFLFFIFIPPVWNIALEREIVVKQHSKKSGEQRLTVGPKSKNWIPYKNISRHLVNATVTSEDGKFYEHQGLDWDEISKSVEKNLAKKRYARGASTLTQQLVKMAFLSREKTLLRKAREALGALLLEYLVPKQIILEWYFNLAEFGDGVYGVSKASSHYFQTKPELLTIQQAIHLALVLPSPNGWSIGLRRRDLTAFGNRRFAVIADQMRRRGFITESQWLNVLATGNFGRPVNAYEEIYAKRNTVEAELDRGTPPVLPSLEEQNTDDEEPQK